MKVTIGGEKGYVVRSLLRLFAVTGLVSSILAAHGETAVGWRGDGSGKYPSAQPVTVWTPEKNALWKTVMPSMSNSCPIIVGERIFVCSEPSELICVNRSDGSILWQGSNLIFDALTPEEAAKAQASKHERDATMNEIETTRQEFIRKRSLSEKDLEDKALEEEVDALDEKISILTKKLISFEHNDPETHEANGYSTPTPVSDGNYVYAVFGTGVVVCYRLDGHRQWIRLLNKPTLPWGHSASPRLVEGKLVVHIENQMTALDAATGDTVWEIPSRHQWGTAAITKIEESTVLITPGGDIIRVADGHRLAKEIINLNLASPIVEDGIVYFIQYDGSAFRLAASEDGVEPELLWKTTPKDSRYFSSPVILDGLIYAINDVKDFSVIDASTGIIIYEKTLDLSEGTVYPSITLAGEFLFISSDNGATLVLKPGRQYQEVARNTLEPYRSTPTFGDCQMIVRGLENLYCIGAN